MEIIKKKTNNRLLSSDLLRLCGCTDRVKIRVLHGLCCSQTFLVIIAKKLVQKVNGGVRHKALVFWCHKFAPWLAGISSENLVILHIQLQIVLFQVRKQFVGSENAGNLHELIIVVVSMEEGLFAEDLSKVKSTH